MKNLGIDLLPVEQQLALAHENFETVFGPPPEIWAEDELIAECERRNRELEEHPERALSEEECFKRLERRK